MPIGLFATYDSEIDNRRFNAIVGGFRAGEIARNKSMLFIAFHGRSGTKNLKAVCEKMDGLGNVIAWQFIDEPGIAAEERDRKLYQKSKRFSPYRPAYFLPGEWTEDTRRRGPSGIPSATDIIGRSDYPWGCSGSSVYTLGQKTFYGLKNVLRDARYMEVIMRKQGLVGYFNFPAYTGGENPRQPTARENRACAYLGLAHGFRMFTWFNNRPSSDQLWDSFRTLKRELDTLTTILADPSALEQAHGELNNLHCSL